MTADHTIYEQVIAPNEKVLKARKIPAQQGGTQSPAHQK